MKKIFVLSMLLATPVALAETVYFWNASERPIAFALYNANDSGSRSYKSGFNKAFIDACSKIRQDTSKGGILQGYRWPVGRAFQTKYADVGNVKGSSLKACVDASGKATGRVYNATVEGSVGANACWEQSSTTTTYPAPEIVRAEGSMQVLQGRIHLDTVAGKKIYTYTENVDSMCHR